MAQFSLATAENLFKTKYVKLTENYFNSANVLAARIRKRNDFVGKQEFYSIPLSFGGGVGAKNLPTSNVPDYQDALVTSKKLYAVTEVDREAIRAASSDEGAFVRLTKEPVQRAVESFMRNWSRIWFGDGSGKLGKGDAATNVSGTGTSVDPYVVTLSTDWNEANFEEKDYVNINSETTLLEIITVTPSARQVSLVGTSVRLAALTGVGPFLATDFIYMQNSKDEDPYGLKVLEQAIGSTLYGITLTRRFSAGCQSNAGGAGITTDMMNSDILDVEKKSGKVPNLIIMSYTQLKKVLNLLEDQKQYIVEPRMSELKGKVSFSGVEFMSTKGAIPMFADRFCDSDKIYYLNDNYLEAALRPGSPEWAQDDGTIFLRKPTSDSYEARYASYGQNLIWLPFHGYRHTLAT